jgi:hypothetical protein
MLLLYSFWNVRYVTIQIQHKYKYKHKTKKQKNKVLFPNPTCKFSFLRIIYGHTYILFFLEQEKVPPFVWLLK